MGTKLPNLFIAGSIFVLVVWVLVWVGGVALLPNWEHRGQFGDLFGSANALFSGLAFAGLIYTALLQKKELRLQRKELKLQREEMAASRAELAAQVKAQQALHRATVGQIKVAAQQARVEALKMDSEVNTPGAKGRWAELIRKIADEIDDMATAL